jgi:hypothetical protein
VQLIVVTKCNPRRAGCDLLQQLQPFRADAIFEQRKPSGIAARSRQAFDKAGGDRIGDVREHDRHDLGRSLQRRRCSAVGRQYDVGGQRNQFPRISAAVGLADSPTRIDPHVAPRAPAHLLQPLQNAACRVCPCGSSATPISSPIRLTLSGCCARAASGHAIAAPPNSVMNSRRFTAQCLRSLRPEG